MSVKLVQPLVKDLVEDLDNLTQNIENVDNSALHKSGDETASGVKTFTNNITAPNQKVIGYERNNEPSPNISGAFTLYLEDNQEILNMPVSGNTTITVDTSRLTWPKQYFTVQLRFYWRSGAKTVQFNYANSVQYINDNVPDFSDGKPHWVVLRVANYSNYPLIVSDAGTEG